MRRDVEKWDITAVLPIVREYSGIREQADLIRSRESELKRRLMLLIEEHGDKDEKGHIRLDLPESTAGYVGMQRQRRVNRSLDEEVAAKILADAGLTEKCYRMVPVLDQDAVMAELYTGALTEEQIDQMFPQRISYAFVTVKG